MPAPASFSLRRFATRDALLDLLCAELGAVLTAAVEARGRGAFAVPGGSTPIPLFERLAKSPLPWGSIGVTLTDERWVAPLDPASNEGLLRRTLARERAAAVTIAGLHTADPDPEAAIGVASTQLRALCPPLDAIVLGAGEDGHVASLFPGAREPASTLDPRAAARYVAVSPPDSAVAPGNRRLSMTVAALVDTRRLILLATGGAKQRLIEQVAAGDPAAAGWPLTVVLTQTVRPAEVWWAP
jgi:6-phosphogluconolactonase